MERFQLTSRWDSLPLEAGWVRAEKPRAVLQIVHGMMEHKERYAPFMEFLAENGISCLIEDHRGHGKSVRSREELGYFGQNGADALLSDLSQVTQEAKREYPGLPVFLMGFSMGALAVRALVYGHGDDYQGLLVCGNPGYNASVPFGLWMAKRAQKKGRYARSRFVTAGLFAPFILKSGDLTSRFAWLNTDREKVRAYEADPLCGFEFTANGYEALLTLMKKACSPVSPAPNPNLPVLFLSGAKDPCMVSKRRLNQAAEQMKKTGCRQVDVKLYPGMRHEILGEPGHEAVCRDVLDTIEKWMKCTKG